MFFRQTGARRRSLLLGLALGLILAWPWGQAGLGGGAAAASPAGEAVVVAEASGSAAKGDDVQAYEMDQVVITATKTPRHPDDVPVSVTIVTAKDIEQQNIQFADEALKQVPGTASRRSKGWADTIAQVNLRGFPGASRTLVLFDGQRLNSGSSQTVRWAAVPVEEIERIEVVRGPFSPLYGGNAMGGVINIITKTPQKLEALAKMGYGTYNSRSLYLGAGHRLWDKVSVKLSWTYQITDGYRNQFVTRTASPGAAATQVLGWIPTLTPTGSPTYIIGDKGNNMIENSSLNGKISWDIVEGQKVDFSFLLNWNNYNYSQGNTYLRDAATGLPVANGPARLFNTGLRFSTFSQGLFISGPSEEYQGVFNLASEHRLTDTTTLKLRAGLIDQPRYKYANPSTISATYAGGPGTMNSTKSKAWSGEVQLIQAVGKKQTLTGGIALNFDNSTSWEFNLLDWRSFSSISRINTISSGRTRTVGVYLQDEITWHPKFSTVVGARLDRWETYDGEYKERFDRPNVTLPSRGETSFNPRLGVLYRPWTWWSWRASVGTTFRPPNVYELYRTWRAASGTLYKSNPNLKPEKALSWEIGTTLHPFTGNTITATFFDNYVRDLIYRVADKTDPTVLLNENAAKAHIQGVELEISQKCFDWLEVFGNTTLLDARLTKNDYNPEAERKKITFIPRQIFNFGINGNYWILNANLSGHYMSKLYRTDTNVDSYNGVPLSYDPFFTLDFKLSAKPTKFTTLSFAVNNILDRKYFQYYLAPARTFWFEASLKY